MKPGDRVRLLHDAKGYGSPPCYGYLDGEETPTDRGVVTIPAGSPAVVCFLVGDRSTIIVAAGESWPRFAQVWPPSDLEFIE